MVQVFRGAVLVVVDPLGVELEAVLRGVDGDGDGPHRGYGLHQLLLVSVGDVHQTHVIGAAVLGVVPDRRQTRFVNTKHT